MDVCNYSVHLTWGKLAWLDVDRYKVFRKAMLSLPRLWQTVLENQMIAIDTSFEVSTLKLSCPAE